MATAPLLKKHHKSATAGKIPFQSAEETISQPDSKKIEMLISFASKKIDAERRGMGPNVSFSYTK